MLENEAKCNNVTFGTQNLPFNMCFIAKWSFFKFLKTQILYERSQILYESKLCVTDSLLQKLQILYYICNRFFMKQMQLYNGKVVLKPDQQHKVMFSP